ncbi:hypothetical protein AAG570_004368 [Ranatra chinensis]|uniref:Uncharacterized protein n=1 Tax=Ranatra chinensis TaxID=642074 RepID=A0ABD0Y315_9HEMI
MFYENKKQETTEIEQVYLPRSVVTRSEFVDPNLFRRFAIVSGDRVMIHTPGIRDMQRETIDPELTLTFLLPTPADSRIKVVLTLGVFLATANGFFMYGSSSSSKPQGQQKLAETRIGQQWTGGIMVTPGAFRSDVTSYQSQQPQQPSYHHPGHQHPGWQQPTQYAALEAPLTVAVPVAVPIHTQSGQQSMPTTLQGTFQSVQLVPCLCPLTSGSVPVPLGPPKDSSESSSNPGQFMPPPSPPIVTTSQ